MGIHRLQSPDEDPTCPSYQPDSSYCTTALESRPQMYWKPLQHARQLLGCAEKGLPSLEFAGQQYDSRPSPARAWQQLLSRRADRQYCLKGGTERVDAHVESLSGRWGVPAEWQRPARPGLSSTTIGPQGEWPRQRRGLVEAAPADGLAAVPGELDMCSHLHTGGLGHQLTSWLMRRGDAILLDCRSVEALLQHACRQSRCCMQHWGNSWPHA